ncbi:MAG: hypothetical protein IJ416_09300, partial [Ruminiclostridium sp.]|nr:hypothetical protein [Ruminiclostridium sp.]
MLKRIFCWVIIFSLIIGTANPCFTAYAAEVSGLSVSDNELTVGDDFEVYVNVPANSENADTASLKVEFDASAFEVKSWEPVVSGGTAGKGDGYFSLAAANAERKIDLSSGLIFKAVMSVKNGAKTGSYNFKLTKSSFSYVADNGYEYIELWSPEVKSISVKVNAEPTVTVPVKDDITVSQSNLEPKDEFEVYINVPANSENADTASLKVEFDASAFEVKSWEPVISGGTAGKGDGYFSLAAANAERNIDLSSGLTFKAVMSVKSGAKTGSYNLKLTKSSFSYVADNGYEYVELWSPTVKKVTVKITAPAETTTTTTTSCSSIPPEEEKPDENTDVTTTTTPKKPDYSPVVSISSTEITTTPPVVTKPPVTTTPPRSTTVPTGFFTTPGRSTTITTETTTAE